jgi:hypothetical protein
LHEEGGPLCLEGGILAAIGGSFLHGDHYTCPAYRAVSAYLRDRTDRTPWSWNDHLAHQRVLAAIQRGEYDLEVVRPEAEAWAKSQVIEVLRACALIEASREREPALVSS